MANQHISSKKTRLVYSPQPLAKLFKPVAFQDCDGFDVYPGDVVEFYEQGEIFPRSGTLNTLNDVPRIDLYDNVFNRWYHYDVDLA